MFSFILLQKIVMFVKVKGWCVHRGFYLLMNCVFFVLYVVRSYCIFVHRVMG